MRSLRKFALVSAALGAGLLAACDEDVTSGSRSDAADAPADLLAQGPPDVPPFQVDTGPLPDGFYDRAPPPLPAGCPAVAPANGTPCTLDEIVACDYVITTCADGTQLERLCRCTGQSWSCIQDLGCPSNEPLGGAPEQVCGTCQSPPGASTCTYRIEKCVAAEDLKTTCTCAGGNPWSCTREYDCSPPNLCRQEGGDNCVTNGLINTGNFCPPGYVQGACAGFFCKPGLPGDSRLICDPPGSSPARSAACVYGQWACPIGYRLTYLPI
jgi:hypothetical protein